MASSRVLFKDGSELLVDGALIEVQGERVVSIRVNSHTPILALVNIDEMLAIYADASGRPAKRADGF